MKRKAQPEGTIVLFLETDLKEAHPFSLENVSGLQKQIFERMSEEEQMKVMEGYGTLIVDLESENDSKQESREQNSRLLCLTRPKVHSDIKLRFFLIPYGIHPFSPFIIILLYDLSNSRKFFLRKEFRELVHSVHAASSSHASFLRGCFSQPLFSPRRLLFPKKYFVFFWKPCFSLAVVKGENIKK